MTNQQDTALLPVEHWERMIREAAEAEAERENEAEGHCGSYGTSTWKDYEKDVRKDFEDIGRAFAALAQSAEAGEEVERVARAIDPIEWKTIDHWWPYRGTANYDDRIDDMRARSMDRARAAIATLSERGAVGEEVERLREALETIAQNDEFPLDDEGNRMPIRPQWSSHQCSSIARAALSSIRSGAGANSSGLADTPAEKG